MSIPASRLAGVLADGAWFDGSSVEGLERLAERDLYLPAWRAPARAASATAWRAKLSFSSSPATPRANRCRWIEVATSNCRAIAPRRCYAAIEALNTFGVGVEATHHEVGPGQYEIDLAKQDALQAADGLVALKWALRALAQRSGLRVSFMPKPIEAASGSTWRRS